MRVSPFVSPPHFSHPPLLRFIYTPFPSFAPQLSPYPDLVPFLPPRVSPVFDLLPFPVLPIFTTTTVTTLQTDPLRKFYVSCLAQRPNSDMAKKWCGVLGVA